MYIDETYHRSDEDPVLSKRLLLLKERKTTYTIQRIQNNKNAGLRF